MEIFWWDPENNHIIWKGLKLLGVKYSWPEQITPESGKLLGSDARVLAQGLPMSKTWRLRMEAFFRPDNRVSHRTIFHGTDGGSFGHTRCGGRLPGIWTRNVAPPISYCFYFSAFKILFFLFRKISKIFGTIEDFLSVAVWTLTRIIVKPVHKLISTNGLVSVFVILYL